jgi:hypothetical protein
VEHAPDIDDTDDLDPTAEFDLWRLRELTRLSRDKERSLAEETERLERERRAALPESQRLREDEEYARKTREMKEAGRSERTFGEKFYHKGAFHQDDEILKRDYGARLESSVDMSLLPKVLQVKNFGKVSSGLRSFGWLRIRGLIFCLVGKCNKNRLHGQRLVLNRSDRKSPLDLTLEPCSTLI